MQRKTSKATVTYIFIQDDDDDSYGEDEFEKSAGEGEGCRRNSPRGGKGGPKNEIGGKVPCEASAWPMSKRTGGLKTLKRLSKANRCVTFHVSGYKFRFSTGYLQVELSGGR